MGQGCCSSREGEYAAQFNNGCLKYPSVEECLGTVAAFEGVFEGMQVQESDLQAAYVPISHWPDLGREERGAWMLRLAVGGDSAAAAAMSSRDAPSAFPTPPQSPCNTDRASLDSSRESPMFRAPAASQHVWVVGPLPFGALWPLHLVGSGGATAREGREIQGVKCRRLRYNSKTGDLDTVSNHYHEADETGFGRVLVKAMRMPPPELDELELPFACPDFNGFFRFAPPRCPSAFLAACSTHLTGRLGSADCTLALTGAGWEFDEDLEPMEGEYLNSFCVWPIIFPHDDFVPEDVPWTPSVLDPVSIDHFSYSSDRRPNRADPPDRIESRVIASNGQTASIVFRVFWGNEDVIDLVMNGKWVYG